jgi:hypothetical protein
MEFRNLTPFHALAYGAYDVHDREHHVVALRVAYALTAAGEAVPGLGDAVLTHRCELLRDHPAGELCVADQYEGEVNASSVKAESDLAAFKPRCDLVVRATAHAPQGVAAPRWPVRLRATVARDGGAAVVVDKSLAVCGPRWFVREGSQWSLTEPREATSVPMRWEMALGGRSTVRDSEGRALLDEVCFTNPLGSGWMEARYPEAMERAGQRLPDHLPAPQVEDPRSPVQAMVVARHREGIRDARGVAEAAAGYGATPAGLSWVARPWTPRIQHAGTYDDAWLRDRHPFLPPDFSFAYWNGAPADQQIEHPPHGLQIELWNLCAAMGYVSFALPPHRAFVHAIVRGLPVPVPAVIDTVIVDAEAMTVACVWRVLVPRMLGATKLEGRFEVDPDAPLLRFREGGAA